MKKEVMKQCPTDEYRKLEEMKRSVTAPGPSRSKIQIQIDGHKDPYNISKVNPQRAMQRKETYIQSSSIEEIEEKLTKPNTEIHMPSHNTLLTDKLNSIWILSTATLINLY